jgi:hypothetical protein
MPDQLEPSIGEFAEYHKKRRYDGSDTITSVLAAIS